MPATSIRDLVIKNDDIIVGTHGRSFWILDNITPLRQINSLRIDKSTILYKPQTAIRVRWNMNSDTPIPQEEPAGENPPDGAIIDYYLKEKSTDSVQLEITDARGKLIRSYSSNDKPYEIPDVNIPLYWIRPQQILSGEAGAHRFLWDMHYTPLNVPPAYPISAIYQNTAPAQTAPWIMPGVYTIKLTVNGNNYTQQLTVKIDPRVHTSIKALQQQHDLSFTCYQRRISAMKTLEEISEARKQLKNLSAGNVKNIQPLDEQAASLQGNTGFEKISNSFTGLFYILQDADVAPTTQTIASVSATEAQYSQLQEKWKVLNNKIEESKKIKQ
jgi:hypothetical protein